jgi:hypothetical protein
MNTNSLDKNYTYLTGEERSRLIKAAVGRSDEAEVRRLVDSSGNITLSTRDYFSHMRAFDELSLHVFVELLDVAAYLVEVLAHVGAPERYIGANLYDCDEQDEKDDAVEDGEGRPDAQVAVKVAAAMPEDVHYLRRVIDSSRAIAFVLRTKVEGWKQFCERMNVPPFTEMQLLPGFERLQRTIARAERKAFDPKDMLAWMNRTRAAGEAELRILPVSVELYTETLATEFREKLVWWGGDAGGR